MMSKRSNVLLSIILVLVLLNLGLTGWLLVNQATGVASVTADQAESLSTAEAKVWGEKVTRLYNQQDHQGLYRLFNQQAKQKISHQQLQTQLQNLYQLFGKIETHTFVSAQKMGEKGAEQYYNLLFNITVSEAGKQAPKLTIVIIKKGAAISIYGVRINANYALDG